VDLLSPEQFAEVCKREKRGERRGKEERRGNNFKKRMKKYGWK